jgi:hypothetical protein
MINVSVANLREAILGTVYFEHKRTMTRHDKYILRPCLGLRPPPYHACVKSELLPMIVGWDSQESDFLLTEFNGKLRAENARDYSHIKSYGHVTLMSFADAINWAPGHCSIPISS